MMRLIYLLILIVLSTTIHAQDISDKKTEFYFEQNLVLGDNPDADSLEYIFGVPSAVVSDRNGNIYVSDDKYGAIRVYSKNGRFIREIGGIGRGPGEFRKVTAMTLLPNDQLLIYDHMQFRIIRYDLNENPGNASSLRSHVTDTPSGPNRPNRPDYIRPMGNNSIISFYRKTEARWPNFNIDKDYLIYITSLDFQNVKEEFVHISEIIDIQEPFEVRFIGGRFSGIFTNTDSTVTMAPFFYRGDIFQYKKTNTGWELSDTLSSYVEITEPYKMYDDYRDVLGKGGIAVSHSNGPLAAIINNESLGIFRLNNGDLLHLALIRIDNERKLYASKFQQDGSLISHGEVTNLSPGPKENGYYRRMRFYWIDQKNQLYILDQPQSGGLTVRRGFIRSE